MGGCLHHPERIRFEHLPPAHRPAEEVDLQATCAECPGQRPNRQVVLALQDAAHEWGLATHSVREVLSGKTGLEARVFDCRLSRRKSGLLEYVKVNRSLLKKAWGPVCHRPFLLFKRAQTLSTSSRRAES